MSPSSQARVGTAPRAVAHAASAPVALLQVDVDKDRSLLLDWDRVRVFDREIAQMFLNMTKLEKEAQVGCWEPRRPLLTRAQGSLCLSGTQTPFREKAGCSHARPPPRSCRGPPGRGRHTAAWPDP